MTHDELLATLADVLDQAGASIAFIHPDGYAGPRYVVVTAEMWNRIADLTPDTLDVHNLFMDHGHVDGE